MWTKAELIAIIRARKADAPVPVKPEPEPGEDPMVAINKKIRAEKLQQFYAMMKRRPG